MKNMSNPNEEKETKELLNQLLRPMMPSSVFKGAALERLLREQQEILQRLEKLSRKVRIMDKILVVVHMQAHLLTGYLTIPRGRRLSDYLNGYSESDQLPATDFIELTQAAIYHANGKKEEAKSIFINRESIEILRTIEENDARGIGSEEGAKGFPYIKKIPVKAKINLPDYEMEGQLHYKEKQDLGQLLAQRRTFIPLTKVTIHDISKDTWEDSGFVAINRTKVYSIR